MLPLPPVPTEDDKEADLPPPPSDEEFAALAKVETAAESVEDLPHHHLNG